MTGPSRWRTWRSAMTDALYGDQGFYRTPGAPGRHFRTAAHVSPLWAEAVHRLATRVEASAEWPGGFTVVDVGAGGGELLTGLADRAPDHWQLVGVDAVSRPEGLPERVAWQAEPPSSVSGLLVAVELLDAVPVDVVERTAVGPRLVEVADDGSERLGAPPSEADRRWLDAWWPLAAEADRAEVGDGRDELWRRLTGSLHRGVALLVDYAAVPARDAAGTLTGFRDGRQVMPVPDGRSDITAHVLVASLLEADDVVLTQRAALAQLDITGRRPAYTGDATAYLDALSAAGEAAELTAPAGLGGFTWLLHASDVPHPLHGGDAAAGDRRASRGSPPGRSATDPAPRGSALPGAAGAAGPATAG